MKKIKYLLIMLCLLALKFNVNAQTPTVSMTAPLDQTSFMIGTAGTLAAALNGDSVALERIDFYANGSWITYGYSGDGINASALWWPMPAGFYPITAVATDVLGNTYSTTDTLHINIILNPPYWFTEGLTQYYNYQVVAGGTVDFGLNYTFTPQDEYYEEGRVRTLAITGYLAYNNQEGDYSLSTNYQLDDTTSQNNGFDFNAHYNYIDLNSSYQAYGYSTFANSSADVYVTGTAQNGGAGISLTVTGSSVTDPNNGIQIYANGMDLNTPGIQLNYFPNNAAMDSVLTTDSLGNLKF